MKKVKVIGKSYNIAYDFATVLAYEDEFDRDLDLTTMTHLGNQLRLYYAVLKAANPDKFVMTFDDFSHALIPEELTDLSNAIAPAMTAFYRITPIAERHVPATDEADTEEDTAKNE